MPESVIHGLLALEPPELLLKLTAARRLLYENASERAEALLRELVATRPDLGEAQGRLELGGGPQFLFGLLRVSRIGEGDAEAEVRAGRFRIGLNHRPVVRDRVGVAAEAARIEHGKIDARRGRFGRKRDRPLARR